VVPRALLLVALAAAALAGGARADAGAPPTLRDGQTRWFVAGQLRPGKTVRCVSGNDAVEGKVPLVGGAGVYDRTGLGLSIERRPAAVQVECGSATTSAPRRPTPPYEIGQNGVGLIRGPNTLAALRRLYGPESSLSHGARCVATWRTIGLRADFATRSCAGGAVSALVTGSAWSSLDGTRVGDSVPHMRWLQADARLVATRGGTSSWLLSKAHPPRRSQLVALTANGAVASLRFFAGR
jgi:hypothetical protein